MDLPAQISGSEQFPDIIIEDIYPVEIKIPDPDLYNEAKRIFIALARAREAKDVEAIRAEQTNLDILAKYGELLTEYPVLIQYLYLKELKGQAVDLLDLGELELGE
jgi:hypothetical protein